MVRSCAAAVVRAVTGRLAELQSAEELARLTQRFDIHVMAFADQSEATVAALQSAFTVDRATAQRMLAETPVVVKRAATPEVAGALLDVLNALGAQVVLLPSDIELPDTEVERGGEADLTQEPEPPPSAASAGWGGLDLPSSPPATPAARGALLLSQEFDPAASAPSSPGRTSVPAPRGTRADSARFSAAAESRELDLEAELDPLGGSLIPGSALSTAPSPLPLLPPEPPGASVSPQASLRPAAGTRALRPAASTPPVPAARVSRAPAVDLGLGTVPPLPPPPAPRRLPELLSPPPVPAPPLPLLPQLPAPSAARPRERKASGEVARAPRAAAGRSGTSGTRPAAGRAAAPAAQTAKRGAAKQAPAPAPARAAAGAAVPAKPVFEIDLLPGPALPVARNQHFPVPAQGAPAAAESKAFATPEQKKPAAPAEAAKPRSRSFVLIALLSCVVLVYLVLNQVLAPKVDYALGVGERALSTGTLVLEHEGRKHRFPLVNMHVVAADVPRILGEPIAVRVLWTRSPEDEEQPSPDIELLFDMAAGSERAIDPRLPDAQAFRGRPLPVIVRAQGAELRSQVRMPGASQPVEVAAGELLITEVLELRKGAPGEGWRIHGELALSLADGDRASGTVDARLLW